MSRRGSSPGGQGPGATSQLSYLERHADVGPGPEPAPGLSVRVETADSEAPGPFGASKVAMWDEVWRPAQPKLHEAHRTLAGAIQSPTAKLLFVRDCHVWTSPSQRCSRGAYRATGPTPSRHGLHQLASIHNRVSISCQHPDCEVLMSVVKVALAQFVGTDDRDENVTKVEQQIAEAADNGARLVVFHELATTTYFCFDDRNAAHFDLGEPIPGPSSDRVAAAAHANNVHVVFPLYEAVGDLRFNTAALIDPENGVELVYRKSHVPTSRPRKGQRGADEAWYFRPGDTGFNIWKTSLGLNVGILICYDRHFPEGARAYGLGGAHIILVPTASYRKFIIDTTWEPGLQSMAWSNTLYVAGINKIGPVTASDIDASYPGLSAMFDPEGIRIARADDQEGITYADVDPDHVEDSRRALNFYKYRRPDLYGGLVEPVAEEG